MELKIMGMTLHQFTVVTFAAEVLAFAIAMLVLYYVVRAAVRDGINESHIARARPRVDTGNLPDMRAD